MIYRRKLRSILNTTETTQKTDSIASDALSFVFLTTDALYIGFHEKFASRYFVLGTLNTNAATLAVTSWNGASWTAVEDLVDQTRGMTQNGWLSWKNVSSWTKSAQTPVTNEQLYWIRIKTNAAFSAGTTLQAILNLFCDDVLLSEWYPELISDTRYLPSGKTNFYEQYNAAKNMVVQELKKLNYIDDESEVINPEVVSLAAAHAAAYCILNGIPKPSEELVERKKDIYKDFQFWITESKPAFDTDNSGEIEEDEKVITTSFFARR